MKETLESLVGEMIESHIRLDEAMEVFERKFILNALAQTKGNQSKAAEILGIHRNSLSRKIIQYKVQLSSLEGGGKRRGKPSRTDVK